VSKANKEKQDLKDNKVKQDQQVKQERKANKEYRVRKVIKESKEYKDYKDLQEPTDSLSYACRMQQTIALKTSLMKMRIRQNQQNLQQVT
jgi:hypothetical protein